MPFTFLAHQAPVVPLKLWRPRWFSGAGLAIGSMAPDFEKFLSGSNVSRFGHTRVGQLAYCLPLAIAVYWLLTRVVAAPLARHAPDLGAFHLRDYATALARGARPGWLKFALSALVGSSVHVLLDGFTHADPRVVALFPALRFQFFTIGGRRVDSMTLYQLAATVVAGLAMLGMLYHIGRARLALVWAGVGAEPRAPAAERRTYWAAALATTALLSGVLAAGTALLGDGWPTTRAFTYSVLVRLPTAGLVGLAVAGLLVRPGRERAMARGVPPPPAPQPPSGHHPVRESAQHAETR